MAISSKVKKEESELRKIIKKSRIAHKEAAARERRQRRKQRCVDGEAPTQGSKLDTRTRKRMGAIVLPNEVAELRLRLMGDGQPVATKEHRSEGKKRKHVSSPSSSSDCNPLLTSSTVPGSPGVEQPPYNMEVHHKRKQVLVNVTLHYIPHQHIDVSETTDTALVVHTEKHTRKYRLSLNMPEGLRIDKDNAVYELECGILKCALPIKGEIPAQIKEEREAMLETIRKQKALRFRLGEDGELRVRSKRALLMKCERKPSEVHLPKQESNQGVTCDGGETDVAKEERLLGRRIVAKRDSKTVDDGAGLGFPTDESSKERSSTDLLRRKRNREEGEEGGDGSGSGAADENQFHLQPIKQKKKPLNKPTANVFEEERKRSLKFAASAGKAAQATLRERIANARAMQQKMQQRLLARSARRETQSARTQDSFARVLEEQKRQLLARAEHGVNRASEEPAATKDEKHSRKMVTFEEAVGADSKTPVRFGAKRPSVC
ncbi:hypothetical protein ERJ75_000750900 [Trypanosoma vivax]|nr:hypothetical protein ERJ75_000750900 [Trypanosoma vivax]